MVNEIILIPLKRLIQNITFISHNNETGSENAFLSKRFEIKLLELLLQKTSTQFIISLQEVIFNVGPHAIEECCYCIVNNDSAHSAVLSPTLRKAPSIWQVRSKHSFQFKFTSHQHWVNCKVVNGFQDKYTFKWITSEKQLHLILSYRLAEIKANMDIYNRIKMMTRPITQDEYNPQPKSIISKIQTYYKLSVYKNLFWCGHKRTFHISQLCDNDSP